MATNISCWDNHGLRLPHQCQYRFACFVHVYALHTYIMSSAFSVDTDPTDNRHNVAKVLPWHTGGPRKLAYFSRTPELHQILTNFKTYFTVRIRRTFVIRLSRNILTHLKCVATLPCEMLVSILKATTKNKTTSVTTHFKSASFSNKAGTLNIWCKSCRMWQLLQTITETIKSLFPVVNFFKICCCWSLVFICWVTGYQNRLYPN